MLLAFVVFGAGYIGRQQLAGRAAPFPVTRSLPEDGQEDDASAKEPEAGGKAPKRAEEGARPPRGEQEMTWLNGSSEEDFIRAGLSPDGARQLVQGRADGPYGDVHDAITRCSLSIEDEEIVIQREGSLRSGP